MDDRELYKHIMDIQDNQLRIRKQTGDTLTYSERARVKELERKTQEEIEEEEEMMKEAKEDGKIRPRDEQD